MPQFDWIGRATVVARRHLAGMAADGPCGAHPSVQPVLITYDFGGLQGLVPGPDHAPYWRGRTGDEQTVGSTMKVKMILPAHTEALSPYFRPIKYSLFPPLGLATLAGYLDDGDDVTLQAGPITA